MDAKERERLEHALETGDLTPEEREDRLWLYHQVADAHMLAGRYARAEHFLREALKMDPDVPPEIQDLYAYYIGVCEVCTGRFEQALTRAMETLDSGLAVNSRDPRQVISPLIVIARALHIQDPVGNAERVDGLLRQAEEQMQKLPDPAGYLSFLYSRLRVTVDRGSADEARRLASLCESIERRRLQMRPEEWNLHRCLMARVELIQGNLDEAEALATQVLSEAVGDRPNLQTFWAWHVRTLVEQARGNIERALEYARHAEQEALEVDAPIERAQALQLRGNLLRRTNCIEEADDAHRTAAGIADRFRLLGLSRDLRKPPGGTDVSRV